MEPHCYEGSREWLLSKILDNEFVGTKEEVHIRRRYLAIKDYIYSTKAEQISHGGSRGDGFLNITSDLDCMVIQNYVLVMYSDLYRTNFLHSENKTVLLMKEAGCRPGYVTLQVAHLRRYEESILINSIVPFGKAAFVSSDIYRESSLARLCTEQKTEGVSNGPSNTIQLIEGSKSLDWVLAFPCISWPKVAMEWLNRTRLYGWPTKAMIDTIYKSGCHVVPVGDKCSDNTLLQWRVSFAVAEKFLIYSLTHVQFQVYGLLKYQLNQMKSRLKQDVGDDDILCSYFMKTLIFHAVENSPQALWQEKNLFVCFWFCFTMLIDWVDVGYCPNYFIVTNNMFQRKVHGDAQQKLLIILLERHEMKWTSLSVGTRYQPSIWQLLGDTSYQEKIGQPQTETEVEYRTDLAYHSTVCLFGDIGASKAKLARLLSRPQPDTDEILAYFELVQTQRRLSFSLYGEDTCKCGNKAMYSYMKKCKQRFASSFGNDLLYMATFYYQTGNFRKASQLCRDAIATITLNQKEKYKKVYCGRGYTTIQKLKETFTNTLTYYEEDLQFCLPHLFPEFHKQRPLSLGVPPKPYAMFLQFLCCYELGDIRGCDAALFGLEDPQSKSDMFITSDLHWIIHNLIGICYQIKGDNYKALMAYRDSLNKKPRRNAAEDRMSLVYLVMFYQTYKGTK